MSDKLCPKMQETLYILGKKWTGLILFSLLGGPKKFTDIEKYIPNLSARMLTERLKELENEGIVKKNLYNEEHIRIEYVLTRKGLDLKDTFIEIDKWNKKWM